MARRSRRKNDRVPTGLTQEAEKTPYKRPLLVRLGTVLAVILIVAYLVYVALSAATKGNLHDGDTDALVAGARISLSCISKGQFLSCGHTRGSLATSVGPYALLQYLPAAVLIKAGLSNNQVIHWLGYLNLIAFAVTLAAVALGARKMTYKGWSAILVVALLGSSLSYQATAGFSEMLQACVAALAMLAVLERRTVPTVMLVALACIGKETFSRL